MIKGKEERERWQGGCAARARAWREKRIPYSLTPPSLSVPRPFTHSQCEDELELVAKMAEWKPWAVAPGTTVELRVEKPVEVA